MIKLDLEKLLLNIFWEDKMENKDHTIISQMTMITMKSLMPNKEEAGNRIDYKRFKEELKLLDSYKIDKDRDFILDIGKDEYFVYKDKTLYARLVPIILSNETYDLIEDEVIKNIIYTTGDIETLLQGILVSKYLFLTIDQEENLLEELKKYIINFSQKEFLEIYGKKYRYDIFKYKPNFDIDFEKTRVTLISLLHGVNLGKFKTLNDLLGILDGREAQTSLGKIVVKAGKHINTEYDLEENYKRMAPYMVKLRKSRIDPDDLKIEEYILPDIFNFKNGEVFYHSLLNTSKVIKKEIKEESLTSLIQTRAGMYLFKRDPLD